jgi:hypothetical protein
VQTEVFHFSLKGWWFAAGVSVSMLLYARRHVPGATAGAASRPASA